MLRPRPDASRDGYRDGGIEKRRITCRRNCAKLPVGFTPWITAHLRATISTCGGDSEASPAEKLAMGRTSRPVPIEKAALRFLTHADTPKGFSSMSEFSVFGAPLLQPTRLKPE